MGLRDKFKNVFESSENEDGGIVQESKSGEFGFAPNRKVLFVCIGNTVRSPIAEAIFNQKATNQKAFSAGLNTFAGEPASRNAIKVCANHGIDLSSHKTHAIQDIQIREMDLILTATSYIRDALKMEYPDLKIFTIKEYSGDFSNLDIIDPFGGDLLDYEKCFKEIDEAISLIVSEDVEIIDKPTFLGDETVEESNGISDGRLILASALEGNLKNYNEYLSLWDENDPDCHIVFAGNLIYSLGDDDYSVEILDDAIEKSKNYNNFHYLLGINELSCIMGEGIYKMGINLKTKFEDLVVSKKGSLDPYLNEYISFFKTLPFFIKTDNGLFISYSGPSKSVNSLNDFNAISDDLNLVRDFLWARKIGPNGYTIDDVDKFLDISESKFMIVSNQPCEEGYEIFSRQLVISSGDFGENKIYLDMDLSQNIGSMEDLTDCLKFIGGIFKEDKNSSTIEEAYGKSIDDSVVDDEVKVTDRSESDEGIDERDNELIPHVDEVPFPAYEGDDVYAFISYAHKDYKMVFNEIKRFKKQGLNIWYDDGIAPGNEWLDEIARALSGASLFIVFISNNSVGSRYVGKEITFAINKNIPVIAIHIEKTQLPGWMELILGNLQAILKYGMNDKEYYRRYTKAFNRHLKKYGIKLKTVDEID